MNLRFSRLWAMPLLLAPVLFAQSPPPDRQAEEALRDELYPLAEQHIWHALSLEHTLAQEADLTLLLLRALSGQRRFDEAVILADESSHLPHQDAFIYWRARALFEASRPDAALQTLESHAALLERSAFAPAALRLQSRIEQSQNNLRAALRTCELFRRRFPADENAAQNLLDLAALYLERSRKNDARLALEELLERFPAHPLAGSARLELARQLISEDGVEDRPRATALLAELGADPAAPARLRSAAWVELSALEQRAGNPAAAADALAKAEQLTGEAALRARQKAARANLLIEENKLKEAFALFDEAVKETPDTATAAEILLQKAEALLKTQQTAEAEQAFQACLDITATPSLLVRAQTGKGWSLWQQQRFEEAAAAFESAAARSTQPDTSVPAMIKAGDARLAAGQFEKARESYLHVLEKYPDHPLAAQALYQSAVAALRAGQPAVARAAFEQTEQQFPQSDLAPQAALQQAELLQNQGEWDAALEQYRRIAGQYTNTPAQVSAIHRQGLMLYARPEQRAAALEQFETVRRDHPSAPEAPQAFYLSGVCRYELGATAEALELYRAFIEAYPDSEWTAEALFRIAEHHYNRGDYARAHPIFLDMATRFPAHELADDALFWAGGSLFRQEQFLEAFTAFSRIAKEFPASPLILQTRFAQGETLTELGEFPRAILAYEEIIKNAPDDPLADRARGRLADCLFTLGTKEPVRYQEALEAYQALYKRPAAPFALRLQALYKIARCEAKLGLKEKAFTHYMEAVYSGAAQTEPLPPDAVPWFTRAAFDAAAYQEQQQQWKAARNIYERIVQAGVPAQDEARKRIEKIEREHASAL
jgi:TolA-binding protein